MKYFSLNIRLWVFYLVHGGIRKVISHYLAIKTGLKEKNDRMFAYLEVFQNIFPIGIYLYFIYFFLYMLLVELLKRTMEESYLALNVCSEHSWHYSALYLNLSLLHFLNNES